MTRNILVVLSEYGYWGEELLGPVTAFDRQGYTTTFATPTGKRPTALPPSLDPGFIDPPLGRAGMTVEQVRASGRPALVGQRPMTRVGRAVEKGETQGFMKVVVDAETQQILGAAILGVGGDEAIHAILDVMSAKAPYQKLARTMHIHPTVCELIPTMLQEMSPLN